MRPSVDNAQPEHFGKMKVNRKRAQLEEERLCEIEKQNGKLLDKLTQIAAKRGVTDLKPVTAGTALLKGEACETRSLNEKSRKLELQRIQNENLQILKRIQQSQEKSSPEINHASLEKAWSETARYRKLASQI
ncbi:hypothetical protein KFL_005200020 [Klebsormidium nitens]|uniref:Uncharacterized protein n=1 Tax=Klebsormidium nitens TaxID=105231 RepID=A0A1Y1IJV6_KLENI|nr:hypothetical protein KFL_005200020 [Klebsormidium nitens]|eukprot:GAQ89421.1 hypothetical protein KFL_005200020 [Klebsormidium nitens]